MQIDMVLDRGDNLIDICEMKFSNGEYEIDAEESRRLMERVETFRRQTGTRKGTRTVIVSAFGLKRGKYAGNIQSVVTLDDLFK